MPDILESSRLSNCFLPLEFLLRELHHGPTTAHVTAVDVHWEEAVPARQAGPFRVS